MTPWHINFEKELSRTIFNLSCTIRVYLSQTKQNYRALTLRHDICESSHMIAMNLVVFPFLFGLKFFFSLDLTANKDDFMLFARQIFYIKFQST